MAGRLGVAKALEENRTKEPLGLRMCKHFHPLALFGGSVSCDAKEVLFASTLSSSGAAILIV